MITQKQVRTAMMEWRKISEATLRNYIYSLLNILTDEQLIKIINNKQAAPGIRSKAKQILNKKRNKR